MQSPYRWRCQVCESSVDGELKVCSVCGAPANLTGEEYKDRLAQWEKARKNISLGASADEIAEVFNYRPETEIEKSERKLWGSNKFGVLLSFIVLTCASLITHAVLGLYGKCLILFITLLPFLLLAFPYSTAYLKDKRLVMETNILIIINAFAIYMALVSPEQGNVAAGYIIFFFFPMTLITTVYCYKSKKTQQINGSL